MAYRTARDLPSFIELSSQIKAMSLLGFLLTKQQKTELERLKKEHEALADTVDQFYDLFGDRNWVFHENLHLEKVRHILTDNDGLDDAELKLIELYDPAMLRIAVTRCHGFAELRKRKELAEKARNDYLAGRYYSCVMVLLAVMDGFVNDLESRRRGLHARPSEEFSAWDTVISHHKGLERVHRVYAKQISTTMTEPVYELYRNGIMHGTVVDFDNVIVATKAWNMFFAVMDWARAKIKAETPPPPKTGLRDALRQSAEVARDRKLMETWCPYVLLPNDAGLEEDSAYVACSAYLNLWQKGNYGGVSRYLAADEQRSYGNAAPQRIRQLYTDYNLSSYTILKVDHVAPALCKVEAQLTLNGTIETALISWMYEGDKGVPRPSISGAGQWKLVLWGPAAFLNHR